MKLVTYQHNLKKYKLIITFFTGKRCSVCDALKPKVKDMIHKEFPLIHFQEVVADEHRELCGQLMVFTLPTVILAVEGKEHIRLARNFALDKLRAGIWRPYDFLTNALNGP